VPERPRPQTWIEDLEGNDVANESSFDVVSKIDRQEVDNALNQAAKEVGQRYDFKNTGASVKWSGDAIVITANSEERVAAVLDVLQTKLVKRGVSLKALETGDTKQSGKEYEQVSTPSYGCRRRAVTTCRTSSPS
jgi:uncharacterized protein YajQ (UPF0234 family)